jgi:hypothetical protein
MQGKITKRAVDGLAPVGGAETTLWDSEVKGFGVRARMAGGKSYGIEVAPFQWTVSRLAGQVVVMVACMSAS